MARPKAEVDEKMVVNLAELCPTNEEIAVMLGISEDTLSRRFAEAIKKGRMKGMCSLRRLQWQSACQGSIPMQIWLGKQMLGQRDKNTDEIREGANTYVFNGVRF